MITTQLVYLNFNNSISATHAVRCNFSVSKVKITTLSSTATANLDGNLRHITSDLVNGVVGLLPNSDSANANAFSGPVTYTFNPSKTVNGNYNFYVNGAPDTNLATTAQVYLLIELIR